MRLPRPTRRPPRVGMTALIDIVFLLLIFVVLVARFVDQERVDLDVPTADQARPAEADALHVVLLEDGSFEIDGEPVRPAGLTTALQAARARHVRAVLVADAQTHLQRVVDVVSEVRRVGYRDVAVATRPR